MTIQKRSPTQPPKRLVAGGAETAHEQAMAALVSQLPPSTPDDLSVERVWRRVLPPAVPLPGKAARKAPRERSWWLPAAVAGGVAVLAVLAVVAAPLLRSSAPVELALTSGGVFSSKLAENWHAGQSGEALSEAERLRTDATGRAVFRIRGVAAVLLGSDSDVGLDQLGRGTFLRLTQGTLTARVSKRKADEPFVIQTDRYRVKVVGTLFTVEEGPGDHTAVSVREGIVEVSDAAGHVDRVVAGQRWTSDASQARTADRTPDSVKTLLEGGLAGTPATSLVGAFAGYLSESLAGSLAGSVRAAPLAVVAAAASPAPPESAPVVAVPHKTPDRLVSNPKPAPRAVAAALQAVAPASAAQVAPAPVTAPPVVLTPVLAPAEAVAPVPAGIARVAPQAAAPPLVTLPAPAPVAAAEGDYARGRTLEAKGDAEAAARAFAKAADTDPAHADIALYALGRLAQRRLHDAGRARSAFERYRDRYPAGALLPEVDLAMLELEVDGHARTAALADSTRFLAIHPGSERIEEVHLLRGNLLRDDGSCREALADYAEVHSAALADDAVYSSAYCQRKLGDRTAAAKTLHDYLMRFPSGAHRSEAQSALADALQKNF